MASENEENHYDSFAEFYDDIMLAGYYDYDKQISELAKIVPQGCHILEIGVGTGLLAEKLVEQGFKVTGIDHTAEMIEIAEKRLGSSVELFTADVCRMRLPATYDCVISNGGVWYGVVDKETGEYRYCGHLTAHADIAASIEAVCNHLGPDGRLVLSTQDIHRNLSLDLPGGGKYTQVITDAGGNTIQTDYITTTAAGEQTETLYLTYIERDVFEGEMAKHGFTIQPVTAETKYIVFERGA